MPEGKLAMGLSNQTSFLRPITWDESTPRRRAGTVGARPGYGRVEIFDDQARLCVLSRVTIAVRDA